MARDGDNPMKLQLHRVGLDGKGDTRLTDPAFTPHASDVVARTASTSSTSLQTHDTPPATPPGRARRQGRRGAREERPERSSTSSA